MKIKLHLISAILIAAFLNMGCKKEGEANYIKATINGNAWKSDLVVVQTTTSSGQIVPAKISGIKGTETINFQIYSPYAGTFPFRIHQINPAMLLSFTVELFESFHKIKWSTGSETNVSLFTIEVSTDGLNWTTAATKTPNRVKQQL